MRCFLIAILLFFSWWTDISAASTRRDSILSNDLAYTFHSSSWVWPSEADPLNIPPEERYFLKTYTPPVGKISIGAIILITADNLFTGLYVNGFNVIENSDYSQPGWARALLFNASLPSSSNSTLFAVQVANTGNSLTPQNGGPAGLLMAVKVLFSDNTSATFGTDATWTAATNITTGWQLPSSQEQFSPVSIVVPYGQGPWGSQVVLPVGFTASSVPITNATNSATPATSSTSQLSPSVTTHPKPIASSELGAGVIAGIVVGAIVLILSITAFVIWIRRSARGHTISPLAVHFSSSPPQAIHPFPISEEQSTSTREAVSSNEKRSRRLNDFQHTPDLSIGSRTGSGSDTQELAELHDRMRDMQVQIEKLTDRVGNPPPEYESLSP